MNFLYADIIHSYYPINKSKQKIKSINLQTLDEIVQ